ncbi:dynamin family protein [Jiangella anatolica]|uniref:Dynamin N-terminal domain-containing protein n=1 Tax=Jiangella anatolica TaxID=2670374 RepID=A0A2W2CL03_9ACTN|nr:dynamin family protein [Jiangella anatolica]PZF86076.1 hypothetical protein C1I92_02530 [Jiangella anatolica]
MTVQPLHADVVASAALEVAALLPPERASALTDAVSRMRTGRVRVLLLGEAKRGKSTLVNALFGRDLLPTGVLPVTSVPTVVEAGAEVSASARFLDGRSHEIALQDVAGLVSEAGNPGNRRGVDLVRIVAPSPYLPDGTQVVDTPGTGSIHRANTAEAERARATVDLAVLVLAADPPVSAAEVGLAADVMATASHAAVVVNKIDLVRPDEVDRIVTFTRDALAGAVAEAPIFAMSARHALAGTGWRRFTARLATQIDIHGRTDVVASTARAAAREARMVLDMLRIQQELLRRPTTTAATTIDRLDQLLATARHQATSAGDHLRGEARRLRSALDTSHEQQVAVALSDARRLLDTRWAGTTSPPERQAELTRQAIQAAVAGHAHAWFTQTATEMDTTMRMAAGAVLGQLAADLRQARAAVAEVLDVELAEIGETPSAQLPDPPSFALTTGTSWRELITSSLADRLPARLRRRRRRRQLHAWASSAVPAPFGRARAGLQIWLDTATAELDRSLATAARHHLSGLEQALAAARIQHERTAAGNAGLLDEIAARLRVVSAAMADLDGADRRGRQKP